MALIDRVCCECKVVYGQKEAEGTTKPTHGYCDACAAIFNAEIDAYFAARPPAPSIITQDALRGQ